MFKKIAKLSDLAEGKIKSVQTRYSTIGLTQLEGKVYAFEDVCTHDGEMISSGNLSGCEIECPRHFAKFDIKTGKALCMPATENLPILNVRISGDDVEVDLEE